MVRAPPYRGPGCISGTVMVSSHKEEMGGKEVERPHPVKARSTLQGSAAPHIWGLSPKEAAPGLRTLTARTGAYRKDSHRIGNKPGTLVNSNLIAHRSWPKPWNVSWREKEQLGPDVRRREPEGPIWLLINILASVYKQGGSWTAGQGGRTDTQRQKRFQIQGRKSGQSQGTPCKESSTGLGWGLMVRTEQGLARGGGGGPAGRLLSSSPHKKPCWVPLYPAGLLGEARHSLGVLHGVSTIMPMWHIVAGH